MSGIQNFIQKYKLMTKLLAIDWCHVQRCAARQRCKLRRNVSFSPQSRHRVTLWTCDDDQSTDDMLDQITPLFKNKSILVDSNLSSSKSVDCLSIKDKVRNHTAQRHLCWIMTLGSHICHRSLSYSVHPCNVYAISTSKIAQRIASWLIYFTFPSFKQAYAHNPRRTYKLPIVLTFFRRLFLRQIAFNACIQNPVLL